MKNSISELDVLDKDTQSQKLVKKSEKLGNQKLEGFTSNEVSQIIDLFNDRELQEDERNGLDCCIKALFLEREREKNIVKAIQYYTNGYIADALEGLYIYFKEKGIKIQCLEDIDDAMAKLKNRGFKKSRACQFVEELKNE